LICYRDFLFLPQYAGNILPLRWRRVKFRINYDGHHIFAALPVNFRRALHAWFAANWQSNSNIKATMFCYRPLMLSK